MAAVMSVHAPRRPGEAKEEEKGLRSASAGVVEGDGCVLTGYRSRRVREEGLLLLLLLLLVRAGITQLFNLKPSDSN